jgi:hypothetical protein
MSTAMHENISPTASTRLETAYSFDKRWDSVDHLVDSTLGFAQALAGEEASQ